MMFLTWLYLSTVAMASDKLRVEVVKVTSGTEFVARDDKNKDHNFVLYGVKGLSGEVGKKSKSSLETKLKDRILIIEYVNKSKHLTKVWVGGREDASIYQLSWGQVKLNKEQLTPEDLDAYEKAENTGRIRKMGIWEVSEKIKVPKK